MAQSRQACLVRISSARGSRAQLIDKSNFSFGRSAEADVLSLSLGVSRIHLKARIVDGKIWVEDQGSSNGTLVDGGQLTGKTSFEVKPGAQIRLGDSDEIYTLELIDSPLEMMDLATARATLKLAASEIVETAQQSAKTDAVSEIKGLLEGARAQALQIRADAEEAADRARKAAQEESNRIQKEARASLSLLTVEAQREADAILREATRKAAEETETANDASDRIVREAQQKAAGVIAESENALSKALQEARAAAASIRADALKEAEAARAKAVQRSADLIRGAEREAEELVRAARDRALAISGDALPTVASEVAPDATADAAAEALAAREEVARLQAAAEVARLELARIQAEFAQQEIQARARITELRDAAKEVESVEAVEEAEDLEVTRISTVSPAQTPVENDDEDSLPSIPSIVAQAPTPIAVPPLPVEDEEESSWDPEATVVRASPIAAPALPEVDDEDDDLDDSKDFGDATAIIVRSPAVARPQLEPVAANEPREAQASPPPFPSAEADLDDRTVTLPAEGDRPQEPVAPPKATAPPPRRRALWVAVPALGLALAGIGWVLGPGRQAELTGGDGEPAARESASVPETPPPPPPAPPAPVAPQPPEPAVAPPTSGAAATVPGDSYADRIVDSPGYLAARRDPNFQARWNQAVNDVVARELGLPPAKAQEFLAAESDSLRGLETRANAMAGKPREEILALLRAAEEADRVRLVAILGRADGLARIHAIEKDVLNSVRAPSSNP